MHPITSIRTVLAIVSVVCTLSCSSSVSETHSEAASTFPVEISQGDVEDLLTAAGDGDLEMVKALVDQGAHVNAVGDDGISALMQAVSGGNVELVKFLLEAGADVNARDTEGYDALMHTVDQHGEVAGDPESSADYWEIMRLLAGAGADLNFKTASGESPLSIAQHYQDSEGGQTVTLLKNLGAKD